MNIPDPIIPRLDMAAFFMESKDEPYHPMSAGYHHFPKKDVMSNQNIRSVPSFILIDIIS